MVHSQSAVRSRSLISPPASGLHDQSQILGWSSTYPSIYEQARNDLKWTKEARGLKWCQVAMSYRIKVKGDGGDRIMVLY